MRKKQNITSKSSYNKSTAHILKKKLTLVWKKALTDKKHVFDEPIINQLDKIDEETNTNCTQCFHRHKYKCEQKVNFDWGEEGEEEAYFATEIEFEAKIQEYEQGESGFNFGKILNLPIKNFRFIDLRAST